MQNIKNSILFQPITVENYANFFKELGAALFYSFGRQYDEALLALMDSGAALGLEETEERLAWKLVNRSVMHSVTNLVKENKSSFTLSESDQEAFVKNMKKLRYDKEIRLTADFFKDPSASQFVKDIQEVLAEWLKLAGVDFFEAASIVNRFPLFFVHSLNKEWRKNRAIYERLLDDTPFSKLVTMAEDWELYRSWLDKQTQKSIFEKAYCLSQLYVPLCGFYIKYNEDEDAENNRVVVDIDLYLREWLAKETQDDVVRVISGGPGSGKSTFAKIFAASIKDWQDVLFIPLKDLNLHKNLIKAVERYLRSNHIFQISPIGKSQKLLIIFDGLDEITRNGVASLDAARNFTSLAQQLFEQMKRNYNL